VAWRLADLPCVYDVVGTQRRTRVLEWDQQCAIAGVPFIMAGITMQTYWTLFGWFGVVETANLTVVGLAWFWPRPSPFTTDIETPLVAAIAAPMKAGVGAECWLVARATASRATARAVALAALWEAAGEEEATWKRLGQAIETAREAKTACVERA